MCCVDSTNGVCIKHLVWSQDAVGIRFSHTQNNQDGSKNFKSQHCYTNPEDFALYPITALFVYMTCFQEILQDTDGPLFPGAEQEDRFRIKRLLHGHEGNLDGYDEMDDIGTHSIRNGATSYELSGASASPSIAVINNRGGWTLGTVRNGCIYAI